MRRKLFCLTIAMVAGVIFSYYFTIKAVLALSFAVLFAFFFFHSDQSLPFCPKLCLWLIIFFTLGSILLCSSQSRAEQGYLASLCGEKQEITGTVSRIEQIGEDKYRLVIKTEGEKLQVSLYQNLSSYWDLCGKTVTFTGECQVPKQESNPRTFNYQLYLKSKGIFYTAQTFSLKINEEKHVPVWFAAEAKILEKREAMLAVSEVSEETRGLLRGILFGDTGRLDEDVYKEFRQNGTAHLLAVSGLHVGILFGVYKK